MSEKIIGGITAVLIAITGVAIIATLVSKKANTAAVLKSGSAAFSESLGCALSPVTGGSCGGGGSLGSMGFAQSTISYPGIGNQ